MFTCHVTHKGPITQKVKKWPAKVKVALIGAVDQWHHGDKLKGSTGGGYLKFHFTGQAFSRYPGVFKIRTRAYERQKANRFPDSAGKPLVWSGRTMSQVTSMISVSGTSKAVHGRMTGANRALNFGGGKRPNMREELLAVNEYESQALAEYVAGELAQYLQDETETETKTEV